MRIDPAVRSLSEMQSSIMRLRTQETRAVPTRDFQTFFQDERASLFRMLVLVTGSTDEAEDIAQEAFLKVWAKWERVGSLENAAGYLHVAAMNCFRSRYRHAVYVAKRSLRLTREEPDPLAVIEAKDAALRALDKLSRRQRAAVVLVAALGFSVQEAAVALSIRPGTVRTLISQARAKLSTETERDDV